MNDMKTRRLTRLAILVAIIFLLTFTPLGYLVIGPIAATTIQMPVVIGAILLGPGAGAVLGGFFGLSAILKIITMPGADPFATLALSHAPVNYLLVCLGARILMGWFSGLLASSLKRLPLLGEQRSFLRFGAVGFLGSMMNTVFYLGGLWLLTAEVIAQYYGIDLSGVKNLVLNTAWAAGIPEAVVSFFVVAAVCKALERILKKR